MESKGEEGHGEKDRPHPFPEHVRVEVGEGQGHLGAFRNEAQRIEEPASETDEGDAQKGREGVAEAQVEEPSGQTQGSRGRLLPLSKAPLLQRPQGLPDGDRYRGRHIPQDCRHENDGAGGEARPEHFRDRPGRWRRRGEGQEGAQGQGEHQEEIDRTEGGVPSPANRCQEDEGQNEAPAREPQPAHGSHQKGCRQADEGRQHSHGLDHHVESPIQSAQWRGPGARA